MRFEASEHANTNSICIIRQILRTSSEINWLEQNGRFQAECKPNRLIMHIFPILNWGCVSIMWERKGDMRIMELSRYDNEQLMWVHECAGSKDRVSWQIFVYSLTHALEFFNCSAMGKPPIRFPMEVSDREKNLFINGQGFFNQLTIWKNLT